MTGSQRGNRVLQVGGRGRHIVPEHRPPAGSHRPLTAASSHLGDGAAARERELRNGDLERESPLRLSDVLEDTSPPPEMGPVLRSLGLQAATRSSPSRHCALICIHQCSDSLRQQLNPLCWAVTVWGFPAPGNENS
ncbi:Cytochrome protein [Platysternon megacephalum]|uniref:Cytochrome protein n=1 Tax=Platysternon megacephalum TaxID=55544 RepID=A0A4D9E0X9_9SAUR|nr:Cytochrome protein [Platysternon megacephalum]